MSDQLEYGETDWEAEEAAERDNAMAERARFDAAVKKIDEGLTALHDIGAIDFLCWLADRLIERYRPPAPIKRGHRRNKLYTDRAVARVFWEHYKAPLGQKQAILRREYENLGFRNWESLQRKIAEYRAGLGT